MTDQSNLSQSSSARRHGALSSSARSTGSCAPVQKASYSTASTKSRKRRLAAQEAICASRTLFLLILWLVAAILGALAFRQSSYYEQVVAEQQFKSLAAKALREAKRTLEARRWAAVSMSRSVAELYPNASAWPYVEWWGFESLAASMLETSGGHELAFVPFVATEKSEQYNDFAHQVYAQLQYTVNNKGIWELDSTNNDLAPESMGDTTYNSSFPFLSPIFRTDKGADPALLFNIHSLENTGVWLDKMLQCNQMQNSSHFCGVITDLFQINKLGGKWGASHWIPIRPDGDPDTVSFFLCGLAFVRKSGFLIRLLRDGRLWVLWPLYLQ